MSRSSFHHWDPAKEETLKELRETKMVERLKQTEKFRSNLLEKIRASTE